MADPQEIPLGGSDRDYNAVRARSGVINLLPEADKNGLYRTVKDVGGLAAFATTPGIGRSNLFVNSGFMYAVCGTRLIRSDEFGTVTDLGDVGGSGRAQILANSVPGDNQIMVLNGVGDGYVYTNGGGLVQVTDPDFFPTVSGTVLGERGWFARRDTNEFFGSEISDFLAYDPLTFATAEQDPDLVLAVIQKKSAIWVLGERSIEYWQTIQDDVLPLRAVIGASKERGMAAVHSLAEAGERFCWLADDLTVRVIEGSTMSKISDLEFELLVRGDGTPDFPGFAVTDDAIGFFVDGPVHKIYYITFPTAGLTWGYDFTTGLAHRRFSTGFDFWRVGSVALFNSKLYGLDATAGNIFEIDQGTKDEDGEILRREITTPSISSPYDFTIPYIELDMEVGQPIDPNDNPMMIVEYSKDGGYTYTTWGNVSLGRMGDYRHRIPMRQFGRIQRHKDFILRFIVTDAIRVQMYTLYAVIEHDA